MGPGGRSFLFDYTLTLTYNPSMPRFARLDSPGLLQHVIVKGIEKRLIFLDDQDRSLFRDRLSSLLQETETNCYAWGLLG